MAAGYSPIGIALFHDIAMRSFRETCPEAATSASGSEVVNVPIVTRRFIREAHAKTSKLGLDRERSRADETGHRVEYGWNHHQPAGLDAKSTGQIDVS